MIDKERERDRERDREREGKRDRERERDIIKYLSYHITSYNIISRDNILYYII